MQSWYQPHPYGIFPRGNAPNGGLARPRFGSLTISSSDESVVLDTMFEMTSFLNPREAAQLSATCTGWYIFLHGSDFWKRMCTTLFCDRLEFSLDWKTSVVRQWMRREKKSANGRHKKLFVHRPLRCSTPLFNDTLFQSWMCTLMPTDYKLTKRGTLTREVPEDVEDGSGAASPTSSRDAAHAAQPRFTYASKFKAIPKVDGRSLSRDVFQETYEAKSVPVVIQNIVQSWPIYRHLNGCFQNLSRALTFRDPACASAATFRCENTTMTVEGYLAYAREQRDERPIYMFDADFGDNCRTEELYSVPDVVGCDDFFKVLGSERPKYRWIIAGPHRGGSSFHVDPNYTHAWNACLTGRKRWLLFPPSHPPPGVFPSGDMSNVTTSVSLTEWLLNFYVEATATLRDVGYEGICEAGEMVFVPAGWWHIVINLEDSVALTQNYVSRTNLSRVIQFLRNMKSSISGIDEDADHNASGSGMMQVEHRREHLAESFVSSMRQQYPEHLKTAEKEISECAERRRKRPRNQKVELLEESSEGFSFSF